MAHQVACLVHLMNDARDDARFASRCTMRARRPAQGALAQRERERQSLRVGSHTSGDLEQRLVGVQRQIDRIRKTAKMPAVNWMEINSQDRALRRRLSN